MRWWHDPKAFLALAETEPHQVSGATLIYAERHRQVNDEGWTSEHDDEHSSGELLDAATEYVRVALGADPRLVSACWPWDESWWKPSDDPIRNLTKAGALIAAEIDRLLRANKNDKEIPR